MGNGICKVLPGLYLGNIRDSKDQQQLNENKITHILSIYDNASPILPDKIYLCINASDTPDQNLLPYFHRCIEFIHEARLGGGSVLVHCLAGISRSVTVTLAYIITVTHHNWRDALSAVRWSRECANPNLGFISQLRKYEAEQVEEERKWLMKTYPSTDSTEDARLIAEMCGKFNEAQSNNITARPPPPSTGSASSSFPLNKKEDNEESSTWTTGKRQGMFGPEKDFYDQS